MDVFSSRKRSEIMRRVRSTETYPESFVQRIVNSLGFRFRTNVAGLPGTPDVVLLDCNTVLQVNGCFWHGHGCPAGKNVPVSNIAYWQSKIARNMRRDRRVAKQLRQLGWSVITIWECQTHGLAMQQRLQHRLANRLRSKRKAGRKTARTGGRTSLTGR